MLHAIGIIFFMGLMMAIKGGQHAGMTLPIYNALLPKHKILAEIFHFITDNLTVSTVFVGLLMHSWIFALAWLFGNKPSLGETCSKIGGYKGNWFRDTDGIIKQFPKDQRKTLMITGLKEGIQRGIYTGALLTLASGNLAFIVAGAAFPVIVWLGISISQWSEGVPIVGWPYYEWMWGMAFGVAMLFG